MNIEHQKTVLGLQLPTDPRWTNLAEMNLEDILTDHAYCEQKAATTGITLIQKFPDKIELVRAIAPLVAEEWAHFRAVLSELDARGLALGKQRKDEYVNALIAYQRSGLSREGYLIELLLTLALVEARSCERFRLLSIHLQDEGLQKFYYKLMVSEAGHYKLYLDLAKTYAEEEYVTQRWKEYLDFEADLMGKLTPRGDRIH